MKKRTTLQCELTSVRAELSELRSHADNPFALTNDDHYWSLCVQEKQLLRLLHEEELMDRDR